MSDYIQIARVKGNINLEDNYIQLAAIRGTPNRSKNPYPMVLDDFYTLCQKDPNKNIGLRKQSKSHHLPVFKSNDVSLEYLCTDFTRFCLSLYKNHSNLDCGEMSLIPKQEIPISKELREYIEDFLPDFYNIRDIVK